MAALRELREKLGLRRKGNSGEVKKLSSEKLLHSEMFRRALSSSANFVQTHIDKCLIFDNKSEIQKYAMEISPTSGLILEFGVFKGKSINYFATELARAKDPRLIYGFDAFLGLSENWVGHSYKKLDRFDQGGQAPAVEKNVRLVNGWIDDTLPPFLNEHQDPIAFLHIDTDTYSPCKTILTLCRERLVPGSIVLFDDLLCYPGWEHGEFKALSETLDVDRYEWVAFAGYRGMIKIL